MTEEDSGATGTERKRRRPFKSFPSLDLGEVTDVLVKASHMGWQHSVGEFAGYLGHQTTNSGAFRSKLAALRDYRVISGRGDDIEITDLGRQIAVAESEMARDTALQEAFMSTVFGSLHEDMSKDISVPIDNLGKRAVNRFGIAPGAQGQFADAFARSAERAKLGERQPDGSIVLRRRLSAADHDLGNDSTQSAEIGTVGAGTPSTGAKTPKPVIDQRWDLGQGGEVAFVVRISGPLSAASFSVVGKAVAAIEDLVSVLRNEDAGD